jgi:hypothetical protein
MKYLLPILLLLTSCGFNGNQKLTTNDSEQRIVQEGESYTYIVLRLEFLEDIRKLCEDANLRSDFESDELYNQAVAQCTLDNLNLFNIDFGEAKDFADEYCREDADLSEVDPEDIPSIQEACEALGLPVPEIEL